MATGELKEGKLDEYHQRGTDRLGNTGDVYTDQINASSMELKVLHSLVGMYFGDQSGQVKVFLPPGTAELEDEALFNHPIWRKARKELGEKEKIGLPSLGVMQNLLVQDNSRGSVTAILPEIIKELVVDELEKGKDVIRAYAEIPDTNLFLGIAAKVNRKTGEFKWVGGIFENPESAEYFAKIVYTDQRLGGPYVLGSEEEITTAFGVYKKRIEF